MPTKLVSMLPYPRCISPQMLTRFYLFGLYPYDLVVDCFDYFQLTDIHRLWLYYDTG